ncbi:MAG TPA: carboxypeptidase regulatory-like domain-containing protein [Terriglobales bacterium]|nr:carboxypeptidase regulatory-like domain-containing protein [Terriglobales bacterium]
MKQLAVGLILISLLVSAPFALAQGNGTCTLTGTVYDASGAVVSGAKVQLISQGNKAARETASNGAGFFSFIGIPASTYDVKVEAQGFAAFRQTGIILHINDQIDLKQIALKVAGGADTVEVTAAPAQVIPESSGDVSYTLTSKQVDDLSIIGRNAVELLKILPGAQNSGGWNGVYDPETTSFNTGAGAYTVNGTRFDQLAVVSDGGNVTDTGFNGGAAVTPNVEMIQEVKVETASFSAENPNGPIVMETVTKSGTKDFHGEVYYTVRDSSMNANDWQNNFLDVARPGSRYQYPGFNIGGPVVIPGSKFNEKRDKLFFFAGFEWMRQGVDLGVKRAAVPTADMRNGNFTNVTDLGGAGIVGNQPCPSDTWTTLPFCSGEGMLNTSWVDQGGQVLLNLYHQPNADPSQTGGYNYISDIVNQQNRAQQLVKLDYVANSRDRFSARYNHEGETIPFPYGLWQYWPVNPYPGDVVGSNISHSIAANFSHTFTPTLTNELNFTATHLLYQNYLGNPDAVSASKLGYPYYGVYNNGLDVIPNVGGSAATDGVADFFNEGGVIPNQDAPKWTYTLSENISKVVRTHLLKAGFYWSHQTWSQRTGDNSYLDQGAITLASWNSLTTNPYADLFLGHVSMFSQGTATVNLDFAANEYDFYALDNWKIGHRFNLNYGLRVDHIGWWYNKQGEIAIFDPSKYDPSAGIADYTGIETHAIDPSVPLSGFQPVNFQLAPSVGFAWDIFGKGKTVLRGGFGTNFYRDEGISAGFKLVQNPPLQVMNYFSPSGGIYLNQLAGYSQSAAFPWLNVATNEDKMPRTYSYNFTTQQQVPGGTLVSLAYVGNQSSNLVGWRNINPVPQGAETNVQWPGQWEEQYCSPQNCRPYYNIAGIYPAAHILKANYNAFQLSAARAKGRFNYWVAYTFGKALGHNFADAFDLSRGYGPLAWDHTQQLKVSFNIYLPSVSKDYLGNNALLNGVLDGWQLSGITEFDSGAPVFTAASSFQGSNGYNISMTGVDGEFATGQLVLGGSTANAGNNNGGRFIVGTPDENPLPLLVCDPKAGLGSHQLFNAACFQSPTPGNNGNYRIPYIHGPMFTNSDLTLFKNFKIRESKGLQFRAEAFNFLNHPIYGVTNFNPFIGPGTTDAAMNLTYTDFGTLPTNATTAGIMTNKFGHRIVQLGLKFTF